MIKFIHALEEGSMLRIALALMAYNPPLRGNYYNLIYMANDALAASNHNGRNIITTEAIYMNNYKTHKTYKAVRIPLTPNSKLELAKYMKVIKLVDEAPLFQRSYKTNSSFTNRMNTLIARAGVEGYTYSPQLFRHVYLTDNFEIINRLSVDQRNLLANYMTHSVDMSRNYMLFLTGSDTLRTKLPNEMQKSSMPSEFLDFEANLMAIL